jgi:hypothetical protein
MSVPTKIFLSDAEADYADGVARKRIQQQHVERRVSDTNGLIIDDRGRLALDLRGARGECACYVWMGGGRYGHWNAFVDGRTVTLSTLPDIWTAYAPIDVKTIENRDHSLLVRQGGVKPEYLYMLIYTAAHPWHEIIGWAWGRDLLCIPLSEPQPHRPAHVMRQSHNKFNRDCDGLRQQIHWAARPFHW